jgi:hypothetical protein
MDSVSAQGMKAMPKGLSARFRLGLVIRLFILFLIGGLILVVAYEWDFWVGSSALQSTNGAYLQVDTTRLAAKVPGYVKAVHVQDFQRFMPVIPSSLWPPYFASLMHGSLWRSVLHWSVAPALWPVSLPTIGLARIFCLRNSSRP